MRDQQGTQHQFQLEGHKLAALAFNRQAKGTPIVFLHGITASIRSWTVGPLSVLADYPWYSLSLPGHYPAAFPPNFSPTDLTPELIARLLATAVRQLVGERPVILVGHSTGGFAALAIAAAYPEMVQGVVCISGFAQGQWTGVLGRLQSWAQNGRIGQALFKANFALLAHSKRYYRQAIGLYAHDKAAVYSHPLLEQFISVVYPHAQQLDAEAMHIWFEQMPRTDIRPWLKAIMAPTLVLFGDSDPIVPPAQGELIAARLPHSRKVTLPDVGHLLTSERTETYHRIVADWISSLCSPAVRLRHQK